jgi:hypothetical protein
VNWTAAGWIFLNAFIGYIICFIILDLPLLFVSIYIYIFVNTDMIKLYCRKTLASFSVFQYKYSLFSIYIDDTKSIEYFISSLTFHLRAIIHLMQICCANEPVLLRPQRHDRIIRRHLFEHNPSDDLHTVPRVQV